MRMRIGRSVIVVWPLALTWVVVALAVSAAPALSSLAALALVGIVVGLARVLPRALAYLMLAIAATVPLSWLSPNLGIIGGLAVLAWLALAGSWMMVRGIRVLPHRTPEPDTGYALAWDPTPAKV